MKLKIGDKIPSFTLTDHEGNLFKSNKVIGDKVLVIYFYPKNFTPGCTKEACSFRDSYEEFKKLGAEVVGISSDSVESHQKFSKKHQLPYTFLSDPTEDIRKKFGVKGHLLGLIPGRETFVIDKNGIIKFKFNSLSASQHMEKALETVKKISNE
ncbi:peroxiredoxin [Mesonia aestuariivivens]|uniref:thioredoxin-dependent peroxiredoxin n=1 Tax=Mesonia aestuariivivens TaxID=2796128 RepID=A0ABS6VYZ0_9FLAO|nr:peroxiredoxin [Mesonia aestuariivivens]MBW2960822.1 peroxiredoxin [Mesonia aestuariivivens]